MAAFMLEAHREQASEPFPWREWYGDWKSAALYLPKKLMNKSAETDDIPSPAPKRPTMKRRNSLSAAVTLGLGKLRGGDDGEATERREITISGPTLVCAPVHVTANAVDLNDAEAIARIRAASAFPPSPVAAPSSAALEAASAAFAAAQTTTEADFSTPDSATSSTSELHNSSTISATPPTLPALDLRTAAEKTSIASLVESLVQQSPTTSASSAAPPTPPPTSPPISPAPPPPSPATPTNTSASPTEASRHDSATTITPTALAPPPSTDDTMKLQKKSSSMTLKSTTTLKPSMTIKRKPVPPRTPALVKEEKFFRIDICAVDAVDLQDAEAECKQLVIEAGGEIDNDIVYPGGFCYDMTNATHPNPLDDMDPTRRGGYIHLYTYEPLPPAKYNPLRMHPPTAPEHKGCPPLGISTRVPGVWKDSPHAPPSPEFEKVWPRSVEGMTKDRADHWIGQMKRAATVSKPRKPTITAKNRLSLARWPSTSTQTSMDEQAFNRSFTVKDRDIPFILAPLSETTTVSAANEPLPPSEASLDGSSAVVAANKPLPVSETSLNDSVLEPILTVRNPDQPSTPGPLTGSTTVYAINKPLPPSPPATDKGDNESIRSEPVTYVSDSEDVEIGEATVVKYRKRSTVHLVGGDMSRLDLSEDAIIPKVDTPKKSRGFRKALDFLGGRGRGEQPDSRPASKLQKSRPGESPKSAKRQRFQSPVPFARQMHMGHIL